MVRLVSKALWLVVVHRKVREERRKERKKRMPFFYCHRHSVSVWVYLALAGKARESCPPTLQHGCMVAMVIKGPGSNGL